MLCNTCSANGPNKELHEKCIYPTILINTDSTTGTGFIVKSVKKEGLEEYDNYAVTCEHVLLTKEQSLPNDITIKIGIYEDWSKLVQKESYKSKLIFSNKSKDIAIIHFVTQKKCFTCELNKEEKFYIGDEIYKTGCGLSYPYRLDYGKITSVKQIFQSPDNKNEKIRISAMTIIGDSGGPIFFNNKVIGITQSILTTKTQDKVVEFFHDIAYVIPIEELYSIEEIQKYID